MMTRLQNLCILDRYCQASLSNYLGSIAFLSDRVLLSFARSSLCYLEPCDRQQASKCYLGDGEDLIKVVADPHGYVADVVIAGYKTKWLNQSDTGPGLDFQRQRHHLRSEMGPLRSVDEDLELPISRGHEKSLTENLCRRESVGQEALMITAASRPVRQEGKCIRHTAYLIPEVIAKALKLTKCQRRAQGSTTSAQKIQKTSECRQICWETSRLTIRDRFPRRWAASGVPMVAGKASCSGSDGYER
jgi:hypothetical protein